jgi:hypothetical protein
LLLFLLAAAAACAAIAPLAAAAAAAADASAALASSSSAPVATQGSSAPHHRNDPLTLDQLPRLTQRHRRVLAVITGAWDWPGTAGYAPSQRDRDRKTHLLSIVLQNYRHACDAGFEVHVVLATYETANHTLRLPSPSHLYCERLGAAVPLAVERFPLEPLPADAHGTGGTLASKHRLLFNRLQNAGYDLFVAQEDDIMVKAHHLEYFARWGDQTPRTGYYPSFLLFEVLSRHSDRRQLSSRHSTVLFRGGLALQLNRVEGETWVVDEWNPAVVHVLTRAMVANFTARGYHTPEGMRPTRRDLDEALRSPAGTWEYNPWFTINWLQRLWRTATPLPEISRALIQHGTNKYLNAMFDRRAPGALLGLTALELERVLLACTGDDRVAAQGGSLHHHHPGRLRADDPPTAIRMTPAATDAAPFPCAACLDAGKGAHIFVNHPPRAPVDWDAFAREGRHVGGLDVTVTCN